MREEWRGFSGTKWLDEVNMREFIQANYTGYDGNEDFLAGPTEATDKLWGRLKELQKEERAKGGVLDMETEVVSSATAYGPGYIDESLKNLEKVLIFKRLHSIVDIFTRFGACIIFTFFFSYPLFSIS